MKKDVIIIGIDPGINTGVGVWNITKKRIQAIYTTKIHKAIRYIEEVGNILDVYVVVEDARLRRWFGPKSNEKIQGAGSIKRDCSIWEEVLKDYKEAGLIKNFKMIHPVKGSTKMNEDVFKRITGYDKRTSSHARDAMMLVFDRDIF